MLPVSRSPSLMIVKCILVLIAGHTVIMYFVTVTATKQHTEVY